MKMKMKKYNRDTNYFNIVNTIKYECKHCGKKAIIPSYLDKRICSWCGTNVYKNDKAEFEDRLQSALKRVCA